jgi:hypothetical protein
LETISIFLNYCVSLTVTMSMVFVFNVAVSISYLAHCHPQAINRLCDKDCNMVKQEVRGETVVMRCDCGKLMEIKRKGGIRWECSRCGFVLPLSHLTPTQPEPVPGSDTQ